ncbi:MAG: extracellular solute-binding protein [Candidatus Woykebacteria bacterium]
MTKKRIILFGILFIAVEIIVGLVIILADQGAFTKKEENTHLSYVGLWEPAIINPLIEEYQRDNPKVSIEYEEKDPKRYFETLRNSLASDAPPDIFWWHSGWGPMLKNDLALLTESVLAAFDFEKTYYPVTKLDAKIGGGYRGIPLEFDGLALIYNKDLLKAKKLSNPPKTWTDLQRTYVPALSRVDENKTIISSAIALGTANNIANFSEIMGLLFLQNGVIFAKDGKINIDKSLALNGDNLGDKAAEFYIAFTKNPKVWDTAQPDSIRAFARGKVAMIFLPVHKLPTLQSQIKAAGGKVKFGVARVPQPPNVVPISWASYWLSGVSAKSKNQLEAWKFIKFLGERENLKKIFQEEAKIRKIGRPYPRIDMARELRSDPLLGAYVSDAPFAKSWYLHPDTFDGALNDKIVEKLKELVDTMLRGSGSTPSSLKKFSDAAVSIIAQYGGLGGITER